jgi:polyisoprenoid-binding protein YceI
VGNAVTQRADARPRDGPCGRPYVKLGYHRREQAGQVGKERPRALKTASGSLSRYTVDARLSRFTVQAFAGGLLSAFAHSPRFAILGISSRIELDRANLGAAKLRMEIRADSLRLLDHVSDEDRAEIERVMREEALEALAYPTIVFGTSTVAATPSGEGQYRLTLQGDLSLHGVTRAMTVPARVVFTGDMLRAFGEFTLKQSDYRIKLVAVAGGVIKVKDELKFSFDLVAKKQE